MESKCQACERLYKNERGVKEHYKRSPVCKEWLDKLHDRDDGDSSLVERIQTFFNVEDNKQRIVSKTSCPACKKPFVNLGNVNKHIKNSLVCQKWIKYKMVKDVLGSEFNIIYPNSENNRSKLKFGFINYVYNDKNKIQLSFPSYEGFIPCKDKLIHIIWNVFLIDKQTKITDSIIKQNNIGYILAILPEIKDYYKHIDVDVEHGIMPYGHEHTPHLDIQEYNKYGKIIDDMAKGDRRNVFIFCNNGYQRSIPFIIYYLMRFHPEEAGSIETALNLVLPQINKATYLEDKKHWLEVLSKVNLFN